MDNQLKKIFNRIVLSKDGTIFRDDVSQLEDMLILLALSKANWSTTGAARLLKMNRTTLDWMIAKRKLRDR